MKFLFLILYFFTNVYSILNKHYCGETNDFKCIEDSTCCKTPHGFRCLSVYNGNCCPDGSKACAENTYCNGKNNSCVKIK